MGWETISEELLLVPSSVRNPPAGNGPPVSSVTMPGKRACHPAISGLPDASLAILKSGFCNRFSGPATRSAWPVATGSAVAGVASDAAAAGDPGLDAAERRIA